SGDAGGVLGRGSGAVVYRVERMGPYVLAVVRAVRAVVFATGEPAYEMGMGNPDGATPSRVVDKLIEEAKNPLNHRYSVSRGIPALREAIVGLYARNYGVKLDSNSEAIATIGAKDALAHLMLAMIAPGDVVVSPNPAYPIHQYGVILAEGEARMLAMPDPETF